jgi:hypothetical protein
MGKRWEAVGGRANLVQLTAKLDDGCASSRNKDEDHISPQWHAREGFSPILIVPPHSNQRAAGCNDGKGSDCSTAATARPELHLPFFFGFFLVGGVRMNASLL